MLARFVDQSRLRAGVVILVGLLMPPLVVAGAAAGALTVLRRSLVDGMVVSLGAIVPLVLLASTSGGEMSVAALALVVLAAVSGAQVLRQSGLNLALLSGLGLALAGTIAANIVIGDPQSYWRDWFESILELLIASGQTISDEQRELLLTAPIWSRMTAVIAAMILIMSWLGLFLGRAWQAALVNPGGFGKEYRALSLGRTTAIASMVIFTGSVLTDAWWIHDFATVLVYVWVVQGFSYVHWVLYKRPSAPALLPAIYAGFFISLLGASPLVVLIPVGGVVGELFDGRRFLERYRHSDSSSDDSDQH